MKYSELLDRLQNLIGYKPTAKEISDILNFSSERVYYTRAQRDSSFSFEEICFTRVNPPNPIPNNIANTNIFFIFLNFSSSSL